MRRFLARAGLLAVVVGVPVLLDSLGGPPRIPNFDGIRLTDTYMPLEPVLQTLALLAWIIWTYLVLVLVLRALGFLILARTHSYGLLAVTDALAPSTVRRLVDVAIGGAMLAATFSASRSLALEAPPRSAIATLPAAQPNGATDTQHRVPETRPYTVKAGDSLWRIAERELGSGFRWREILKLNEGRTFEDGRTLTNPRLIHPGWKLRLPAEAAREPAVAKPEPARTQPARHAEPTLSPTSVEPVRSMEHAPTPTAIVRHVPRAMKPAMRLPSGVVVAASFASGVLTAELLARLRRRRSFRPLDPQPRDEIPPVEKKLVRELRFSGASPVPGRIGLALEAAGEAWSAATETWPRFVGAVEHERAIAIYLQSATSSLPPASGGTVSPTVSFHRDGNLVRADVTEPFPTRLRRIATPLQMGLSVPLGWHEDAAVHAALLGCGGASVTGNGTEPLLRQMVLALAADSSTEDLEIIAFGSLPAELNETSLPHVKTRCDWADSAPMLHDLQTQSLRRSRIMFEERIEDLWSHLVLHPDERFPAILILASEPPAALRGLIEAIARQGPSFGAAVVCVGWASDATGLRATVDDGLTVNASFPTPGHLQPFTLDDTAGRDALAVIRETWGEAEEETEVTPQAPRPELIVLPPPVDAPPSQRPEQNTSANPTVDLAVSEPEIAPSTRPIVTPSPPPGVPAMRCLGPVKLLSRDGRDPQKGVRSIALELVAYLVAYPAGASRDRLIEALWPDAQPRRADLELNRAAYFARKIARGRDDDSRQYVERKGENFILEEGAWWCDVWEFARLASEGQREPDVATGIAKLGGALALYLGEFCDDKYYAWAEPIRERLRSTFLTASTRLSELLCDQGDPRAALDVLTRALDVDPLCEDLHRRAMLVQVALGNRGAALARYKELKKLLADQLSITPSPETEMLARQIEGPRVARPESGRTMDHEGKGAVAVSVTSEAQGLTESP